MCAPTRRRPAGPRTPSLEGAWRSGKCQFGVGLTSNSGSAGYELVLHLHDEKVVGLLAGDKSGDVQVAVDCHHLQNLIAAIGNKLSKVIFPTFRPQGAIQLAQAEVRLGRQATADQAVLQVIFGRLGPAARQPLCLFLL